MQLYWILGSYTGAREGHECLCLGFLCWMAMQFEVETIVVEVR